MTPTEKLTPEATGQRLIELAHTVRDNPHAREAIAEGFELIGRLMTPCEDCGSTQGAADPAAADGFNPDLDTTGQA